jgi:predicted Zn-dependent protease
MLGDYVAAEKIEEPYFFSSHPRITERLENYQLLVRALNLADDVDCRRTAASKESVIKVDVDKSRSQVNDIDVNIDKSKSQVSDIDVNIDKSRSRISEIDVDIDKSRSQVNNARKGNCMEDDIGRGYFNIKVRNVVLYDAAINLAAGRYETVEAQLGRLLSVDSGDVEALVMRGDMERMLSPRGSAAMVWYEKALSSDPDNAAVLRAAGFASHSTGDFHSARIYLRKYCRIAAGAPDIKMAKEALRQCEE